MCGSRGAGVMLLMSQDWGLPGWVFQKDRLIWELNELL